MYAITMSKSMFGRRVHFDAKHQIGVTLTEKGHLTTLNRETQYFFCHTKIYDLKRNDFICGILMI